MGSTQTKMRIYHRYLGYFLAGIMAVYAISGFIMIFRNTDFLKRDTQVDKTLKTNMTADELGKELRIKDFKVSEVQGDVIRFQTGSYNKLTGEANYTTKAWPKFIEKITHLHKASTKDPLFYLNIFFAISLLFFVVSAFWMFLPKTTIFKKGLYFTLAGVILTIILLFI
jgi:hypothetical protein